MKSRRRKKSDIEITPINTNDGWLLRDVKRHVSAQSTFPILPTTTVMQEYIPNTKRII